MGALSAGLGEAAADKDRAIVLVNRVHSDELVDADAIGGPHPQRRPLLTVPARNLVCGHPAHATEIAAGVERSINRGEGENQRVLIEAATHIGPAKAVPAGDLTDRLPAGLLEGTAGIQLAGVTGQGQHAVGDPVGLALAQRRPATPVPAGDAIGDPVSGSGKAAAGLQLTVDHRQREHLIVQTGAFVLFQRRPSTAVP